MADRGRDVSEPLTEVRTVLSRAESALDRLDWCERHGAEYESPNLPSHYDPDAEEMRVALRKVVELLEPWRRTGRPRKT